MFDEVLTIKAGFYGPLTSTWSVIILPFNVVSLGKYSFNILMLSLINKAELENRFFRLITIFPILVITSVGIPTSQSHPA